MIWMTSLFAVYWSLFAILWIFCLLRWSHRYILYMLKVQFHHFYCEKVDCVVFQLKFNSGLVQCLFLGLCSNGPLKSRTSILRLKNYHVTIATQKFHMISCFKNYHFACKKYFEKWGSFQQSFLFRIFHCFEIFKSSLSGQD